MLLFDKFSPFTSVVTFDFRFQPLHIKIYQVIINGSMNTWLILAQEPYVKFSFVDSLIFFFFSHTNDKIPIGSKIFGTVAQRKNSWKNQSFAGAGA